MAMKGLVNGRWRRAARTGLLAALFLAAWHPALHAMEMEVRRYCPCDRQLPEVKDQCDRRVPCEWIPGSETKTTVVARCRNDKGFEKEFLYIQDDKCKCGICALTSAADCRNSCVDVRFRLRRATAGESAGFVWLNASAPSAELATPRRLAVPDPAAGVEVIRDNGVPEALRQVLAPECLIDITNSSSFAYVVRYYHRGDLTGQLETNEYYVVDGAEPFATYLVSNPAASTSDWDTVRIVRQSETVVTNEYVWTGTAASNCWTLSSGNGLRVEDRVTVTNAAGWTDTRIVKGPNGTAVARECTVWRRLVQGQVIAEQVVDSGGAALTTRFWHYENPADTGRYARVRLRVEPDGAWKRYDYDREGRETRIESGLADAGTNATADAVRSWEYSYTSYNPAEELSTNLLYPRQARRVVEKAGGTEVGRTYHSYYYDDGNQRVEIEKRCLVQGAAYTNAGNLCTTRVYNPKEEHVAGSERIRSITWPDGRKDTYDYEAGNYVTNASPALNEFEPYAGGHYVRVTLTHGTAESPGGVAYRTTRETQIEDRFGRVMLEESYVCKGASYQRVAWAATERNVFG